MHCERWSADTNASNINHLSTTSEPGSDNTIDDINSSNQTQNKAYPSAVFPKIFSNSKDIIRAAIELEDEAVIKLLRNSVKGNPLFHSDKTWLSLSSFLVTKLLHILEDIDSTTNFQTFQVQSRIKKLRERCQRKFPKCFASIDNFLKFESDLGSIILKCIPEHTGLGHTANFKYYDPFRKCFVLSNSWGENWGDCGHFRIAEDDIFEVFNYQIVPTSIIDIVINDQAPKSVLDNVTKYKAAYNEHLKYILRCFESSAGILQELLTLEATLIKSCENGDVEAIRSGFRKASQLRWLDSFENCRVFKARDDNNIGNKLNINIALDQVGNTLLHLACYHNYPEIVKLLLSNEFIHLSNVKTVNFQNNTPLEIACIQGHPKLVKLLLPSSSDNVAFKDKPSVPLLCACRKGNYDIVNQLLHLYYGPNGKIDGANQICLFEACKSNRIEVVELILSRGVDVNTIENASWTPIQVACAEKVSILIIKLLIRHGCKVLDRDIDGHCLTHRAYLHGCRIPVIELFLSKGVHIDEVDGSARTLLFNACIKDDTDMVAWLLSKGANIYIGDGRFNPFTFSVYQGLTDMVRLLLWERQVNEDRMFSSAFHIACMNSDSDMIAFLLQSGADVNAIDEKGRYPIEYAYSRGHFHIVRMIHNSPNFNIDSDVSGIFFACYHNLEDMVEFLISKNVDINVTNSSRGETPLHIACFKGHKGIVKLLLSQPNIDIDKTCNSGHSPLDYARSTASSASPSSSVGRDSANAGQFLASPRFFPAAGSLRRSRSFGNSLESTAGEHLMFRSCSKLSSLVPADTPVSYSGRPLARSMSNNGFTINTDEPFEEDIISMLLKAKSKCD
jgi:ankyrin repeat protein